MLNLTTVSKKLRMDRYLRTQVVFGLDLAVSLLASLGVLSIVFLIIPGVAKNSSADLSWLACSLAASAISFRFYRVYRAIIRYSTLRELGRLSLATLGKGPPAVGGHARLLVVHRVERSALGDAPHRLPLHHVRPHPCARGDGGYIRHGAEPQPRRAQHTPGPRLRHRRQVCLGYLPPPQLHPLPRGRLHHPRQGDEGHLLAGLPVYYFEDASNVRYVAEKADIDGVLFPYVADARSEQDRLINFCREAGIKTYITPGIDEMTEGKAVGNYVRKIKIEDLLGRPEIKISMDEIIANFSGKVIMVTGAAGSIGSELCRQLATFGVRQLVLFDNAETPLHNIRLELEDTFPELDFVPVIGDVRSIERLDFVFRKYRPQVVFHAAAYKHVPLMEENPCEAVRVNVCGSRQVADKCVEYDVEKMVMVSTDKAVNPTNIMGCTKRLAEIYVQSLGLAIERGEAKGKTKFVTTRFGNVLGSNGSVIPRFREQIEHGGPITVTHREIRRFFMTIPEACRLVMEAATFSTGTQIFVFDMGESVKISTLAERMINLAGLEVGRDIRIEYTGLRPGGRSSTRRCSPQKRTPSPRKAQPHLRGQGPGLRLRGRPPGVMTELNTLAERVDIPDMVILMKRPCPSSSPSTPSSRSTTSPPRRRPPES